MDNVNINAIHNDFFKAFETAFKMGQSVARENFSDIEQALCKGKRMMIESFRDWLRVSVKTAKSDISDNVNKELVLNTILKSMEGMADEYDEKLNKDPELISREIPVFGHGGSISD